MEFSRCGCDVRSGALPLDPSMASENGLELGALVGDSSSWLLSPPLPVVLRSRLMMRDAGQCCPAKCCSTHSFRAFVQGTPPPCRPALSHERGPGQQPFFTEPLISYRLNRPSETSHNVASLLLETSSSASVPVRQVSKSRRCAPCIPAMLHPLQQNCIGRAGASRPVTRLMRLNRYPHQPA